MTSSLVGSEMCIRDRSSNEGLERREVGGPKDLRIGKMRIGQRRPARTNTCLLYTSDAADDM
eukprot:3876808-Prorocentrum_lima.AAC.1